MCGIAGIVSSTAVNQALYEALTILQHRGQDAAGIVTCEGSRMHMRKDSGLVRDVFHTRHMRSLTGNMGIGHVRYPTAGCSSSAEAQPFYVNSPYGITLAHNGNLTNAIALKQELFVQDQRHINTDSDSEVLLNVFAHELQKIGKLKVDVDDVCQTVARVHQRCRGAYGVVAMITGFGIIGFRDPYGIRPLVFGEKVTEQGTDYMIASESVALDVLGFKLIRDVKPGEAIVIEKNGRLHTKLCAERAITSPCIFEYVYFARPDSIIDDISVYKARMRMGDKLADKILRERPCHDIDVVIPIPDTSRNSALQLATRLGVKYREGFIKNRYIGRTFIMPGQELREKSVRQKLNAIGMEFKGKNVLLVDDSIVRGTTSMQIIQMARDAGAAKVYFASASPPVRYPNVYGIDMPAADELIAHGLTEEEIQRELGADWLIYQDLHDLLEAVHKGNRRLHGFDTSCFNNVYVTGDIDSAYLDQLGVDRSDNAKMVRGEDVSIMELHNSV
ncbi:amidophosphoribosyltransferase [Candidatus Methylospira mobilis]|uniref:Amidophosphoribosyltransferase n=1 Tax=Candidatus Methylospira mobilis TaxID=1808979 RepID=A0A5Q0BFD0_9GAMM|nr:amidophosphoribosyltransferase [Candidatus Methylospira mobilis]QFY42573.1 amidophosphoribosyltransferase [Candidatus Methylospira mobilis]WNV04313.1 amidophosphoribosyltransferase [Candidatus Methylospira mobilis]